LCKLRKGKHIFNRYPWENRTCCFSCCWDKKWYCGKRIDPCTAVH